MTGSPTCVAIGFTGAFGSGCTTAAKHLRDVRGFTYVALSKGIRARWASVHGAAEASRADLQRLGDEMRENGGTSALVDAALEDVDLTSNIVIDGIRNEGEVLALQAKFGYRFTLIAITATAGVRWERLRTTYTDSGRSQSDFLLDDERDRNEETTTGQQVELCVDRSDVFIDSSERDIGAFREKVLELVDLVTGVQPRYPTDAEIQMNIAYGASHSSKCLKRHVGAVVVDTANQVVGVGYNENPLGTLPCALEPEYDKKCFRDVLRNDTFVKLARRGAKCPMCGEPMLAQDGPPWNCAACAAKSPPVKTSLDKLFFPDRAMNWCTAIHAEVWALLAAGTRARGGTLYTTTFPCFQCTEKIIQTGISTVCFTEAYPDAAGEVRFQLAKVTQIQFEGVRSSSFHRIFAAMKPS